MNLFDDNRAEKTNRVVQVLLPLPVGEAFDYTVPSGCSVEVGDYVEVPVAGRTELGVVWSANPPALDPAKIKTLKRRVAVPAMPAELRRFIDWVAEYTLQPRGLVLKLALTVDSAQEVEPQRHYIYSTTPEALRLTPARQQVLAVAGDGLPRSQAELAREAGCTAGVVRDLIKAGALKEIEIGDSLPPLPDPEAETPPLSVAQQEAADELVTAVKDKTFSVTLLEGITGSGKTEVYAHAIRQALREGKQVLVLMPEIALTTQMLARFTILFAAEPVQWHSELAHGARQRIWRQVARGEAKIVLGARSALFLPFHDLGLIVVDEEHDGGYKQEEGVSYHARDMAVVRGQMVGAPVILASATPSLETEVNVRQGKYRKVFLPDRHANAQLPTIHLVDLLKSKPERGRYLAPASIVAVRETLARGEQVLLFLNRRGYAPLTICRGCGHRLTCPHCTAWLVEHRGGHGGSRLLCHHCGHHEKLPPTCPHCAAVDSFAACGPGVERIEAEARECFENARILVVASDTLGGWKQTQLALDDVTNGKYNLVIGTQLVAKGHHFPNLTLVIIVDADLGLEGGDVRAGERCFQLLQQVSGRAGRAELPGCVFVQTHLANNFLFQTLARHDREAFIAREIDQRIVHHWPPFARLASLIISGRDDVLVENAAKEIRRKSPQVEGVEIFGPAPAPLAKLRGEHRVRLLVRTSRDVRIQKILTAWLSEMRMPRGVHLKIVIDPFTFL